MSEQIPGTLLQPSDFPAGLYQPAGASRFSLDSLLLVAFAARRSSLHQLAAQRAVDLGCGCAPIMIGLHLLLPEWQILGLEKEEVLAQAARKNIARYAQEEQLAVLTGDIADRQVLSSSLLWQSCNPDAGQPFSVVLMNPPYWAEHEGRQSPHQLRNKARRSPQTSALAVFFHAAAQLLRHHGYCFLIYDARLLERVFTVSQQKKLGVRAILPIHPFKNRAARRLCIELQKDAAGDLCLLPPLYLHEKEKTTNNITGWTKEALAFCPFIKR